MQRSESKGAATGVGVKDPDYCSQAWLTTPLDVLQADWQEVWHSPQPSCRVSSMRSRVFKVTMRGVVFIKNHLS